MKRLRFALIFVVFLFEKSYAQPNINVDSLEFLLQNTRVDTVKISSLRELCKFYEENDVVKALDYANRLYELSTSLHNDKGKFYAFESIAIAQKNLGNLSISLTYSDSALMICRQLHLQSEEAVINTIIGMTYQRQGKYGEGIKSMLLAKSYYEDVGDSVRVARVLNNIGTIYLDIRSYDLAINCFTRCLNIKKRKKDRSYAKSLNHLASAYIGKK